MTSPAGWFPDPAPPTPGQPPLLRYWDGRAWTGHTAPAAIPPGRRASEVGGRSTTPDGAPLAGWWHRVGASLLDSLILLPLVVLVALPWIRELVDVYGAYFDDLFADLEAGRTTTRADADELQDRVAGATAKIAVTGLVLGFVYHVGFLMWRQATPGKLITGLRVRLREQPGPMPLRTVLLRWLGQFGVGIAGLVPYVGGLTGIYSLLDALWPLWDGKRQAIHDKVAGTNVVRVRR